MPITILAPETGDPFGLGFQVHVQTDFVGPIEAGSYWLFTLTAPANEDLVAVRKVPSQSAEITTGMYYYEDGFQTSLDMRAAAVTGSSGQLRVQIISPSGFNESATVPIVINNIDGLRQALEFWIGTHPPAGSGVTLTPEEHNAVLQTNVGVIAMAGIDPLTWIGDLANALQTNPPLGFGSLSGPYTLTGDGEMPDIGDLLHTKLGIYFIATIPSGLSHRHGQSEEYPARLIQWRTVHEVGGLEMVTEVVDFQTHGELWKWAVQKPSRIEYSVLPGVSIEARWWQFP